MMAPYAANTNVSTARSLEEIESLLLRHGAANFYRGVDMESGIARIEFKMNGRFFRIDVPLPNQDDREFTHTPERMTRRDNNTAFRLWEQACRQRYRALLLMVKALIEAIELGVITWDTAFQPYLLLPNGKTLREQIEPRLTEILSGAHTANLLPGGSK